MIATNQTNVTKDAVNKKLTVVREFDAPIERVWEAWTEKEILDQWWAPRPWRAETKTMDFREGGLWHYAMVGPDGAKSWCRVDFKEIVTNERFIADDYFCDEDGNDTNSFPHMHWKSEFSKTSTGTTSVRKMLFSVLP